MQETNRRVTSTTALAIVMGVGLITMGSGAVLACRPGLNLRLAAACKANPCAAKKAVNPCAAKRACNP